MPYPWPQLDPIQQNELLEQITATTVAALPAGWRQLVIDYRAVGRNIDVAIGFYDAGGVQRLWKPPTDLWRMFQRLRGGMYQVGEGTWFSARYSVEPPGRFRIQYNWRREPAFEPAPAAEQFAVEQERFPRAEAHMPDWYRERLAAARA